MFGKSVVISAEAILPLQMQRGACIGKTTAKSID